MDVQVGRMGMHTVGKHAFDGLAPGGYAHVGRPGANRMKHSSSHYCQVIGLLGSRQRLCPDLSSLRVKLVTDLLSCICMTRQA